MSEALAAAATLAPREFPSVREAFRVWLRVAALSFGGPAGQIAVMHRIIVEEKRWVSEARFLHALNYCMLLPGPEAQQLADTMLVHVREIQAHGPYHLAGYSVGGLLAYEIAGRLRNLGEEVRWLALLDAGREEATRKDRLVHAVYRVLRPAEE